MLATAVSASLLGIEAVLVEVEVNASERGDPELILVGLPDAAVKESEDRVYSALANSGYATPGSRTTINLAPGDLRKEGPIYDLPIALGILVATGELQTERLTDYLVAGELGLSGVTRPVRGALAMTVLARKLGKRGVLLPAVSAEEAALVEGIDVHRVTSLDEAARFLGGEIDLPPLPARRPPASVATCGEAPAPCDAPPDFSEIKGQHAVRRAVEVAVAGNHNLSMFDRFNP